jgi:hypothetical protein
VPLSLFKTIIQRVESLLNCRVSERLFPALNNTFDTEDPVTLSPISDSSLLCERRLGDNSSRVSFTACLG